MNGFSGGLPMKKKEGLSGTPAHLLVLYFKLSFIFLIIIFIKNSKKITKN